MRSSEVARAELPLLRGIVETLLKPLAPAPVFETFRKHFTIVVPSSVSIRSNSLMCRYRFFHTDSRHEVLHPHHQHVLVVAAVEHADLAVAGARVVHAPQVVLRVSRPAGTLKLVTRTPAGFSPEKTVRIVPSLPAASIACSTNRRLRLASANRRCCSSSSLQLHVLQLGDGLFLVPAERVVGVALLELERLRVGDAEFGDGVGCHGAATVLQSIANGQCRHPLSQQYPRSARNAAVNTLSPVAGSS